MVSTTSWFAIKRKLYLKDILAVIFVGQPLTFSQRLEICQGYFWQYLKMSVRPSIFILYSICHDFVPVVVYFWLYIFAIPTHFLVFSYANCESFTKKYIYKIKTNDIQFFCVFFAIVSSFIVLNYGAVGWNLGFSRFHNRIKITHTHQFFCA